MITRPVLLTLLRGAWVLVALGALGLVALTAPHIFGYWRSVCAPPSCADMQLTPGMVGTLQAAGRSPDFYGAYFTLAFWITAPIWLVVGAFIFWRRPDDPMALLAAIMLVAFGVGPLSGATQVLQQAAPGWQWLAEAMAGLGQATLWLFFFTFPNGRFVPRWTAAVLALGLLWQIPADYFARPGFDLNRQHPAVGVLVFAALGLSSLYAQVYRYLRVSTVQQRQQTKWVVYGAALGLLGFPAVFFLQLLSGRLGTMFANDATISLFMLAIPISLGSAVLRYRLYEIDVLIRRTLIYAIVAGLLALAYLGSVLVLQAAFATLFRSGPSEIVTVLSTLGIVALLAPLRGRVRDLIDRRFYRGRYDAARAVAAFGSVVRDEFDLDRLGRELTGVVQDAMQPAHVSLWLNFPGRGTESLPAGDTQDS